MASSYKETELTNWLQITKSVTTPAFYRGKIDAYDQKLGQTALLCLSRPLSFSPELVHYRLVLFPITSKIQLKALAVLVGTRALLFFLIYCLIYLS